MLETRDRGVASCEVTAGAMTAFVVLVKLLVDHGELPGFEGRDGDSAPRLGAAD